MISVNEVSKSFRKVEALKGVSMTARRGKITGILGPNGCGKTTLIKSILGLVVPDQGRIQVGAEQVGSDWSYRSHLGYLPQNPEFPSNLSVRELLDMLEDIRGMEAPRRRTLEELFDLEEALSRPFGSLSGGTRQKVAAVAAFMFDPDIWVLDEPTVGLDPVSAAKFKKLVAEAADGGKSILLVTHILSEIETLVDELVFMLDGEVRFSGTLEALKERTGKGTLEEAVVALAGAGKARASRRGAGL